MPEPTEGAGGANGSAAAAGEEVAGEGGPAPSDVEQGSLDLPAEATDVVRVEAEQAVADTQRLGEEAAADAHAEATEPER
jgi:hypothetical protein